MTVEGLDGLAMVLVIVGLIVFGRFWRGGGKH